MATEDRSFGRETVGNAASAIASTAGNIGEQVGRTFQKTVDNANSAMNAVAEKGEGIAERTGEAAGNLRTAMESSVRSQPMTTLMLAASAGFLLGALWKTGK